MKNTKSKMKKKDMIEVLKLSEKKSTFYNFVDEMQKHNILIENNDKTFSINEKFHFKGFTKNNKIIKTYSNMIIDLYGELSANDFGLVYKMLPFLNYEFNVLCTNPQERDWDKVNFLNGNELAKVLEMRVETISRAIKRLVFRGQYLVASVRVGRTTKYYLNPSVFYRKAGKPCDEMLLMFRIKK
jgi:hypothetical protein